MSQIIPFPIMKKRQNAEGAEEPIDPQNIATTDDLLVAVIEQRNRMTTVTEGLERIRDRLANS